MVPKPSLPTALAAGPWASRSPSVRKALEALQAGPEPEATAGRLAGLLDAAPALAAASLEDDTLAETVALVCGSGRALPAIATALGDDALEPLRWEAVGSPDLAGPEEPLERLRRGVKAHILGIAALDLRRTIKMPQVGAALSDLADAAGGAALHVIDPRSRIAVIALGKWGGRELNYASDIDLVFVHDGGDEDAIAASTRFIELLARHTDDGIAYRVDANLRPEGSAGPLSRTVGSYRTYWERWARPWEFQAMLKARAAAGDKGLAAGFIDAAGGFVYPETLGSDAVREIRAMKGRSEGLVTAQDELKRGTGGIRDIEWAVQLLQLVHGRSDPELRSANTLAALAHLGSGGYVDPTDAETLADAYTWLRDVEHRVQLRDLRQTHSIPVEPQLREALAKTLGYRDGRKGTALEGFEADLVANRTRVREIHERLFYRPLLEEFADSPPPVERVDRQLTALGFTDSEGARAAMRDLTAGLSRRSRLMQQLLPLMLGWLSEAPDPDSGLSQLRLLVTGAGDNAALVAALRDSPGAAERLCRLLGTARVAAHLVDRIPGVIPALGDDAALAASPSPEELVTEAETRAGVRGEQQAVMSLHRLWGEQLLKTIAADVSALEDDAGVGRRLSDAADAVVAGLVGEASDRVRSAGLEPPSLAVIALGKWGGRELNYSSDLDGLIVFEPMDADSEAAAIRIAEALLSGLGTSNLGLAPPRLDLDLRPEGKKGVIARSMSSYEAYWDNWALTWEFQALLRARPAAGDPELAASFVRAARERCHPETLDPSDAGEIRRMKARIEKERIPLGEDPDFHVKLGRGALADVEWTVQLLQMQHGRRHPELRTPSTRDALDHLGRLEILDDGDTAALSAAYDFCSRVRNRLFLRAGRTRDSLPTDQGEAAVLARSLGYEVAPRTALREDYRRTTRRARRIVERVFFGL